MKEVWKQSSKAVMETTQNVFEGNDVLRLLELTGAEFSKLERFG